VSLHQHNAFKPATPSRVASTNATFADMILSCEVSRLATRPTPKHGCFSLGMFQEHRFVPSHSSAKFHNLFSFPIAFKVELSNLFRIFSSSFNNPF
jgi:hypothetical protein